MSVSVYLDFPTCPACGRGGEHCPVVHGLTHNVDGIVDLCLIAGGATKGKIGYGFLDPVRNGWTPSELKEHAGKHWYRLIGWYADDVIPILRKAVATACDPSREAEFRALQGPMGWGKLESVQQNLKSLLDACLEHPEATIDAWG